MRTARNYDPTRTQQLRTAFVAELRRRFARLRAKVFKLVVKDDAFRLAKKPASIHALNFLQVDGHDATVAVDFDGRIATLPPQPLEVTVPRDGARAALTAFKRAGLKIIVWTARDDWEDLPEWLDRWKIPWDELNENTEVDSHNTSRKVSADIFLDDRGEGDPDAPWPELTELVFKRLGVGKSRVRQSASDRKSLYSEAEAAKQELRDLLLDAGLKVFDSEELPVGELEHLCRASDEPFALLAPLKPRERAEEKVESDYGGDWSKLTDVVRATVAARSFAELQSLRDRVDSEPVSVKDRFAEPLGNGYRDILELHRLSGYIVEIQYHLMPLLAARERQHTAYGVVRAIKAGMRGEGRRRMTEAEKGAVRQAKKEGSALLAKAWAEVKATDPTLNAGRTALDVADFVTLPEGVAGTNCGNCKYEDSGACQHPKLKGLRVTDRDCCAYWDALGTRRPRTALNADFSFQGSDQQLKRFLDWLRAQFGAELDDEQLWEEFAMAGFARGAGRAYDDAGDPSEAPGRGAWLRRTLTQPESVEKVKLLAARSYSDLQGVTEFMATTMGRVLAGGLAQGANPRDIADDLDEQLGIGLKRADVIARTEIVRAHAEGQLHAFEGMGVSEVGVDVEWSTAGDERVCEECEAMEGKVFSVEDAHDLIPLHPQCRCAFLPAVKELADA